MEQQTSKMVKMLYTVVTTFKEQSEERLILFKFIVTIQLMHQDLFLRHIQTVYQSWSLLRTRAQLFASLIFLTVCILSNKFGEKLTE
jgi:hypothetical protein